MSAPVTVQLMTTEEMLALPDNGMDRELINGQLRERPMTYRNRWHSRAVARVIYLIELWLESQPDPRGQVLGGEAGFRLRRDPDTTVGIDAAYVSPEVASHEPDDTTLVVGAPILAVEVLSPSDTHEDITEKVDAYLRAGVRYVWIVDTHYQTVHVYRPNAKPRLFNLDEELTAEPEMPGLKVRVADIFK